MTQRTDEPTTSGDEDLVKEFNKFCHQHYGKIYPPLKRLFVEMLDTKNQQIAAAYDKGLRKGMESSQAVLDEMVAAAKAE